MIIVALSGGSGSRLWPYSNASQPKQFLNFQEEDTFLKIAVKTYQGLVPSEKFFVVTSNPYKEKVKQNLSEVSPSLRNQVLVEPYSRNTLPAIAWALRHLLITKKAKPSDNILIVPTDHVFSDHERLREMIISSEKLADEGKIVSFGVSPLRAETGYGYIRKAEGLGNDCYTVDSFIEKPEAALAEKFIQNEDWLWNIGLYLFKIETFLQELETHAHAVHHFMKAETHHEDYVFRSLSPDSVDKGLIEKTTKLAVCKLEGIEWSDIGSWESLYHHSEKDENNNVKVGKVVDIDTKGCIIVTKDRAISTIGLEDLIIVDTKETILIAKKSDSKKIKDVLEKMKESSQENPPLSV